MKGIDPKLNEDFILASLHPNTDITLQQALTVFYLCAVCCYDRRLDRIFFGEVLDLVREGVSLATKMECGANIYQVLKELDVDRQPTVLLEAIEGAAVQMQGLRARMLHKMELVVQCPLASDNIS